MELPSLLRVTHRLLCDGHPDGLMIVHMDRGEEEYTGRPVGVWPRASVESCPRPQAPRPGDQGDAALGSRSRPVKVPKLSWDARDCVLGLQLREQGKDVVIYLDVADVVAITGMPAEDAA